MIVIVTATPHTADYRTLSEKRRDASLSRRAFAGGPSSGRPRNPDRCPCGLLTRARAAKRYHKCPEYAQAA